MFKWLLLLILAITVTTAQAQLRDPTQPLSAQAESKDGLKDMTLHSVLISAQRKVAVIDGFPVRENEALPSAKQWTVQKIEPSAVIVVNQQQRRRRLELDDRINPIKSPLQPRTESGQKHEITAQKKQTQGCHSSTCIEVNQ